MIWIVPLFFDGKIITVIHDPEPHIGERNLRNKIITKLSIIFSDALITHGNTLRKELFRKKINKKVFIIPHGEFDEFHNIKHEQNAPKEQRERRYTLLFFGRIVEYKGLDILLKSLQLTKIKIPNIILIIAGRGDLSKYQQLMEPIEDTLIVENRFILDEEIPILFKRVDVVVLPYKEATQSGVLSLAYSFKRPVVTTSVGAIPEVADHKKTALIVKPNDYVELANSIIYLLENPKIAKKIAHNGHKKSNSLMSWKKIGRKLVSITKEVTMNENWH